MSEIIFYDPNLENICQNCMGSGHIIKTLYKVNEGWAGHILTFHCPVCNGSGFVKAINSFTADSFNETK